MLSRRDRHLLDQLKERAALVRPGLLRALGLNATQHASPEPCPWCDATGSVWRLRPDGEATVHISSSLPPPPLAPRATTVQLGAEMNGNGRPRQRGTP